MSGGGRLVDLVWEEAGALHVRRGGGAARLADGAAHSAAGRVRHGGQAAHRRARGGQGAHGSAVWFQTFKICCSRPKMLPRKNTKMFGKISLHRNGPAVILNRVSMWNIHSKIEGEIMNMSYN